MSRLLSLLLFLPFLFACNSDTRQSSGSDTSFTAHDFDTPTGDGYEYRITCWGVADIELEDSYTIVEEKVGKSNLTTDSLFLEGMFEKLFTSLWKGTEKEIKIFWKEKQAPFRTIESIEVSQPNSAYQFANGIKIGSTLSEMEKLNGKPISLYGFGWDYGGTFISFNEGKLAGDIPCFGGVFQLKEPGKDGVSELLGDHQISSNHMAFANAVAELKVIRLVRK